MVNESKELSKRFKKLILLNEVLNWVVSANEQSIIKYKQILSNKKISANLLVTLAHNRIGLKRLAYPAFECMNMENCGAISRFNGKEGTYLGYHLVKTEIKPLGEIAY